MENKTQNVNTRIGPQQCHNSLRQQTNVSFAVHGTSQTEVPTIMSFVY